MTREQMSKLSDIANVGGVGFLGIAISDIQTAINLVAGLLGIIATGFTIWFHISRLLKERRK